MSEFTKRRALILTLPRARGSLTAARALHEAGWYVGIGTPDARGMVTASRAVQARHVVPRPRGDGTAFVEGVRRAIEDGRYDIVFGGADDWMAGLSTHRDDLPVAVAHPPAAVVAAARDTAGLVERATAVGLHAPQTVVADGDAIASWRGPVVVKCRTHWFPGQRHLPRIEARRFREAQAATERIRAIRGAGFEPLLQRPVSGRLCAVIGLFHGGRLHGRVQQVTSRLWPTPSGVSTRSVTVALDEDLVERCEALLADLDWCGLVELQFLTGADGIPHLIDLNGRFYGSMALAISAGPNLPDAWARRVLGLPEPQLPDGRPGVRYLWIAGDLHRAVYERRGGLVRDVTSTLRWWRGAVTSVWDRRDPGPMLHLVRSRYERLVGAGRR